MKPSLTMLHLCKWTAEMLTIVAMAVAAPLAVAADASTAKVTREAAHAVAVGDLSRAIELYRAAWNADPQPETMLSLARAEHLDGQMESAFEHYHAYLANPGSPTAAERIEMARRYAGQIQRMRFEMRVQKAYADAFRRDQVNEASYLATEEAREMSLQQQADAAFRSGDEKTAAGLYLGAYRPARDRDDLLLFKAAVEEEYAREWPVAIAHLEEFLNRASPQSPAYSEAAMRLQALRRRTGIAAVAPPAEPPPPSVPAPPPKSPVVSDVPSDDNATLGWSLVTVGAAVALVGAGSYIWTYSQQSALEANGQTASSHALTSLILGGVGVATAGAGTYLILRTPSRVALAPGPTPLGMAVAWRF